MSLRVTQAASGTKAGGQVGCVPVTQNSSSSSSCLVGELEISVLLSDCEVRQGLPVSTRHWDVTVAGGRAGPGVCKSESLSGLSHSGCATLTVTVTQSVTWIPGGCRRGLRE